MMSGSTPPVAPDDAAPTDAAAFAGGGGVDAVFSEVYARLKLMARRRLRAGGRHTLDTTALVHELYLRIGDSPSLQFVEPGRFLAYAARAIRHLLSDRARARLRQRAGGAWIGVTLDADEQRLSIDSAEEAIAMESALARLERADPRAGRVVELRYFAGLSLEQAAQALGVARRTVDRDWEFARAFLHAELE
ncbi:MAG: sigma-70 family RNA polymerase sigma factor [Xanthomonadales bacterium]|nr:sigma-70 family RNA polymerase sigma factor [Xanthomonadales bacterium]